MNSCTWLIGFGLGMAVLNILVLVKFTGSSEKTNISKYQRKFRDENSWYVLAKVNNHSPRVLLGIAWNKEEEKELISSFEKLETNI